jgi:hypothetical protein
MWKAYYFNNKTLTGAPVLTRDEAEVNYDWAGGNPGPGVNEDAFSARWTRTIDLTPGTYRFTAVSDDGIRAWIDGVQVLNEWADHPATAFTFDKVIGTGHHEIVVEYYENAYNAVAKFSWTALSTGPTGPWHGEYFNNATLTAPATFSRDDTAVDFNWGIGGPGNGVGNDNFSVRWTGTGPEASGSYRFFVRSDDGARLWVNGHLLIDQWTDHPATTYSGDTWVPSNAAITLEYYEKTGYASVKLWWGAPEAPPAAGETVVDNTSGWFVKGGTASSWRTVAEGFGGSLLWTFNNDWARTGYNWARWYPHFETSTGAGKYEVFVYIPDRYTTTGRARYWVSHSGGYTLKILNQSLYHDQWVSLGTYTFRGSATLDYVSLSDVTGETRLSRLVAWDAVKWVPR